MSIGKKFFFRNVIQLLKKVKVKRRINYRSECDSLLPIGPRLLSFIPIQMSNLESYYWDKDGVNKRLVNVREFPKLCADIWTALTFKHVSCHISKLKLSRQRCKPKFYYFRGNSWGKLFISISYCGDQDQTARSVQSDLDLHCPQRVLEHLLAALRLTFATWSRILSNIVRGCKLPSLMKV